MWCRPTSAQQGFQQHILGDGVRGRHGRTLLDSGKLAAEASTWRRETLFFGIWSLPNFHEKTDDSAILTWPVYGWNYDVLIGGLYPNQNPEWDYNLHGLTLELAFPVTMANKMPAARALPVRCGAGQPSESS